jgi:RNA polymerase sigma factor (sigma-70 family)
MDCLRQGFGGRVASRAMTMWREQARQIDSTGKSLRVYVRQPPIHHTVVIFQKRTVAPQPRYSGADSVIQSCKFAERPLPGLVHIVDDDTSFRVAIERRLKKAGYEVATYQSAQHLLDRLPSELELGCILLDVRMPELSGPELQDRLNELGSTLPIVFLTGHTDFPTTVRTIKAGAEDFLTKPVSSEDLLAAVERAVTRHEIARGRKVKLDTVRACIARLTPRERQVFELIVRGNSNKQAANTLGSTERTIKAHRQKVMEKMQVRSVAELVSLAERVGVLDGTSGSRETA